MSDGTIRIDTKIDTSEIGSALKEVQKSLQTAGEYFKSTGKEGEEAFRALADKLKAVDVQAGITGDRIGALTQKKQMLRDEINRLITGGLDKENLKIKALENSYNALGGAQTAMVNTAKKTGSKLSESFAKMRDIMQGPIAAVGMLRDVFESIGAATVGQAGKIENFVAAFTPLTGSAENAKTMIAALNKEAASTPFELEGIANIAKQLLPVLGNSVDDVTGTFRMLGDTAGGNIEKLDSITRGYVKTMSAGKVSMESLNMISDAGVPIQKQLAQSMGLTDSATKSATAQLFEMITAGKVSDKELTKAFQNMTKEGGLFFNGMTLASQTLEGKTSTMSDAFKTAGGAIGEILLPGVKSMVDAISGIVGGFASWAKENGNLERTINSVGIALGVLAIGMVAINFSTIFSGIATGITAIKAAVTALSGAMAINPFGLIAIAASAAALVIADLWQQQQKYNDVMAGTSKLAMKEQIDLLGSIVEKQKAQVKGWEGLQKIGKLPWTSIQQLDDTKKALAKNESALAALSTQYATTEKAATKKAESEKRAASMAVVAVVAATTATSLAIEKSKELSDTPIIDVKENTDGIAKIATDYNSAIDLITTKTKDGAMSQEEAHDLNKKAIEAEIESLYALGITADDTDSLGGKMLAQAKIRLKELEGEVKKKSGMQLAFEFGSKLMKGIAQGIRQTAATAVKALKWFFEQAGAVIGQGIEIIGAVASGFASVLTAMAEFDPGELYTKLDEFITGIQDFFTNDIGSSPIWLDAGVKLISGFISGLQDQFPQILITLSGALDSMIATLAKYGPGIIKGAIEIVFSLVETILSKLPDLVNAGGEIIVSLIDGLTEKLPDLLKAVSIAIGKIIPTIVKVFPKIVKLFIDLIVGIVQVIADNADLIVKGIFDIITAINNTIITNLPTIISAAVKIVMAIISGITNNIGAITDQSVQIVTGVVNGIISALPQLIPAVIDMIIAIVEAMLSPDNLQLIITAATNLVETLATTLFTAANINKIIDAVITIITTIVDIMINNIDTVIDATIQIVLAIAGALMDGKSMVKIITAVIQIVIAIIGAMLDPKNIAKFIDAGGQLIAGLVLGLIDGIKGAFDQISTNLTNFVNSVKSFFGIASPSKMFAEIGGHLSSGIGVGFNKESSGLFGTVKSGLDDFKGKVSDSLSVESSLGLSTDSINSVMSGLQNSAALALSVASRASLSAATTNNVINLSTTATIDGKAVARASYKYVDSIAGAAYGA